MSGAVVFVRDRIVGVIIEDAPRFGSNALRAARAEFFLENSEISQFLGWDGCLHEVHAAASGVLSTGPPGPVVVGQIPQPAPSFQPRPELLTVMTGQSPKTGSPVVFAVSGIRGVGKSQLAAEYARQRLTESWRVVAWVAADDRDALVTGLARIATALQLSEGVKDAGESAMRVRNWLEADGRRCLLVFDDAPSANAVRPFFPAAGQAQIIVTSSHRSVASLGIDVPVQVFTLPQASAFLTARTGLAGEADATAVAEELGCLPLALAQAASVIARRRLGYDIYRQRLAEVSLREYLGQSDEDPYPRGTAEAIILSLNSVGQDSAGGLALRLLEVASLLSSSGTSRAIFSAAAGTSKRSLFSSRRKIRATTNPAMVDRALQALTDASLLTWTVNGESLSAHRLVMRAVRERAAQDGTLWEAARRAVSALEALLPNPGEKLPDPSAGQDLAQQVPPLADQLSRFPSVLDNTIKWQLMKLRNRAAFYYMATGRPADAIAVYEPLVAECERLFGDVEVTLAFRNDLGLAYQDVERNTEAIRLHEHNFDAYRRKYGNTHPATLMTRINLARGYHASGRLAETIGVLEQLLSDLQRKYGKYYLKNPNTLTVRNNLGMAYRETGRFDEAIKLLELNVAERSRILGANDLATLGSRNQLGDTYSDAGRLTDAIELYELNLAEYLRLGHSVHPETLTARDNLGVSYRKNGQLTEAIELLEYNLAEHYVIHGEHYRPTLQARNNLADAYKDAGRLADAIKLYEQNLAACLQVLGTDHSVTQTARENLQRAKETDPK